MSTQRKIIYITFVLLFLFNNVYPQSPQEENQIFRIQRLSERVLVLTNIKFMENNTIIIASKRGLNVVDPSPSPIIASQIRKIAIEHFGRDDFAYVINTHSHWDHTFGNQVFMEAKIVGHERCISGMRLDHLMNPGRIDLFEERFVKPRISKLSSMDPKSQEAQETAFYINFYREMIENLQTDFKLIIPTITFTYRMTLFMGDLTIRLYSLGSAHSDSDIFIQIPEEKLLLTGDFPLGIAYSYPGITRLDVPQWIETFNDVLNYEIDKVIPGHTDIYESDVIGFTSEYLNTVWTRIEEARTKGVDLEWLSDNYLFEEAFPEFKKHLKQFGYDDSVLEMRHQNNIQAFWRQFENYKYASIILMDTFEKEGLNSMLQKYKEIITNKKNYYLDEIRLSTIAGIIIRMKKDEEAVYYCKLHLQLFPNSAESFFRLADAYRIAANKELAIQNANKALELDPTHQRAKALLRQLK